MNTEIDFTQDFQLAAGSVIGREHRRTGRNNQDAYHVQVTPETLIAVVCDGCGSGQHSEVGAKIGAKLLPKMITQTLAESEFDLTDSGFWTQVCDRTLSHLHSLIVAMGGDYRQESYWEIVSDYFLFTLVSVIFTRSKVLFSIIGDGITFWNKNQETISFLNNTPPYLAYNLKPYLSQKIDQYIPFQISSPIETKHIQSLVLGTDGVKELIQKSEHNIPGKTEKVGHISQFWTEDRYYKNPDQLRRTLSLINREITNPGQPKEVGLLPDDTTLIVIRKTPPL